MWDGISLALILIGNERRISLTLKFYVKSHKKKKIEPYGPT